MKVVIKHEDGEKNEYKGVRRCRQIQLDEIPFDFEVVGIDESEFYREDVNGEIQKVTNWNDER